MSMRDLPALSRRALLAGSAAAGLLPAGLMTAGEARAQGITPKRGGTLTSLLNPEPAVLVLGVNNQAPTLICGSKIFQGLCEYGFDLQPKPLLAKSWDVSADRRTYTFHLQEGVTFHDGQPFTADDVIFSVMKFNFELAPRARSVFAKIRSATAPDPHTAVLTLGEPFEPFLLMFDVTTVPIVPKHVYDVPGPGGGAPDYRNNPANQHPIGTGAFRFVEWSRGNFIRLARYDKYWKPGQPYLDELVYRIVPDSQSRALAMQTGQAQLSGGGDIEPFDVPRFQSLPNVMVETRGWELFSPLMWLELNHRVKPLDDVRVRQAISLTLDRDFIQRRLWFGVGKVATGPVSSTTRFYDTGLKPFPHDVKRAAALLDEAGLKPGADGVRFKLRHLVLPYGEIWSRLGEYIRASLKTVGIEVTLESSDTGGWAQRVANWDYDTTINYLYQYGDPTLGVERTYVSTNIKKILFANTGGYSNPEVDKLFATASAAPEAADRQKAFFAVQELLVREIPQVWLLEMSFPTIHDRKVHDVVTLGTGIHAPFDDVFIA